MGACKYNNVPAIRNKHEQKTYTEHNKNPTRKECGHTHIHITYIFVQTSRQTRFKYVFSCVHTIFSTGSHWPNHATLHKIYRADHSQLKGRSGWLLRCDTNSTPVCRWVVEAFSSKKKINEAALRLLLRILKGWELWTFLK